MRNTITVRSIASLIESTALSPRSPTESRSLAVREEIDINPLTPELLQRISSHGRSREAELGLECKEAAVRCQNATRALQDAIEMSRTGGPSLRVRRGRRLKRRRLDQEHQGEDYSAWIQNMTGVEKKVVSGEETTVEKATATEHDTEALAHRSGSKQKINGSTNREMMQTKITTRWSKQQSLRVRECCTTRQPTARHNATDLQKVGVGNNAPVFHHPCSPLDSSTTQHNTNRSSWRSDVTSFWM